MKKSTYIIIFLIFLFLISLNLQASIESNFDLENILPDYELDLDKEIDSSFTPEFNVKGIYVTGWLAGTDRMDNLIDLVETTILNSMVIDIKDEHGHLSYISDIPLAKEIDSNKRKIEDLPELLKKLNEKGIHTIARLVLFNDSALANSRSDLALNYYNVNTHELLKSKKWANPARREVWDYNIQVAKDAIEMGFDEIQFDYIRFPAQTGRSIQVLLPRRITMSSIINEFSDYALEQLSEFDVPVSIDVFGLTTTVSDDLGIGQNFAELADKFKIISPMIYPSHYGSGIYGIENPALEPYRLINRSLKDALRKIDGLEGITIRPWLQDFSLKDPYTSFEVQEQIRAVEELGIKEWLLWNPGSNYQKEALLRSPF